jgi:predicted nucleic acid-binding protein
LIDADDSHHDHARAIWLQLAQETPQFSVPNFVTVDVLSLVSRRYGLEKARGANGLMSLGEIMWSTPVEHSVATRRFPTSVRALSFVDCTTLTLTDVRGMTTTFAFDEDFTHAGFTLLAA